MHSQEIGLGASTQCACLTTRALLRLRCHKRTYTHLPKALKTEIVKCKFRVRGAMTLAEHACVSEQQPQLGKLSASMYAILQVRGSHTGHARSRQMTICVSAILCGPFAH